MKINRTFSDDAPAGIACAGLVVPPKHRPQKDHGRPHFSRKICWYHSAVSLTAIQIEVMTLPPGYSPQLPEDFFHEKYICNPWAAAKHTDSFT